MALDTVEDYVADARVLLNDLIEPFRYPDADLVQNLNRAVLEARRLRPDLFLETFDDLPEFTAVNSDAVDIDHQYRVSFLYYICGQAILRDEEETQDARAVTFVNSFKQALTGA